MNSEKDEILNTALEFVLTERIEGKIVNKDYLGYWSLLESHILNSSINSFKSGVESFYRAIKIHDNAKDLFTFHMKFMIRCVNSENVMCAAKQALLTLKENLRDKHTEELNFDMLILNNTAFDTFTDIETVLLFLFLYEDRIAVGVSNAASAMEPESRAGRRLR